MVDKVLNIVIAPLSKALHIVHYIYLYYLYCKVQILQVNCDIYLPVSSIHKGQRGRGELGQNGIQRE